MKRISASFVGALLQGPIIAIASFAVSILAFAPIIILFFVYPLVFFIPFLGLILSFIAALFVWTVAARLAGSLAGLRPFSQQPSFFAAFWEALPLVLVLKILAAVFEYVTVIGMAEMPSMFDAQTMLGIENIAISVVIPALASFYTLAVAMVVVPRVCGVTVRDDSVYVTSAILVRAVVILPLFFAITIVAEIPIAELIKRIDWAEVLEKDPGLLIDLLKIPVFYVGALGWLLAGFLLSFEANILKGSDERMARAPTPGDQQTNYRSLRQNWSHNDSDKL